MIRTVLRYAISDRNAGAGDPRGALLQQAAKLVLERVDFLQLREKDLAAGELTALGRAVLSEVSGSSTKLIVNGRADVAVAIGADGVHLTSGEDELTPLEVRQLYAGARLPPPLITVSCHTLEDVLRRRAEAVSAILFGPVFEKVVRNHRLGDGFGVGRLREACAAAEPIPVLALGGITIVNVNLCLAAGAKGFAGIRMFRR